MNRTRRIALLGLGNVLMGDDGVGSFIVKVLKGRYEFPENVILQDLGTPGLGLTSFVGGYDSIILIDSVHATGAPGDLRLFRKHQLFKIPPQLCVRPQDPALLEALRIAELRGWCPQEVLLVGIVPQQCEHGGGLSPAVMHGIDSAVEAVIIELQRLGVAEKPRTMRRKPAERREESRQLLEPVEEPEHVPSHSR